MSSISNFTHKTFPVKIVPALFAINGLTPGLTALNKHHQVPLMFPHRLNFGANEAFGSRIRNESKKFAASRKLLHKQLTK
jgi:hypothetical protein